MDYILKASAVLIIFFCCYKLFLQKETFFKENRWFLFVGIIISLVLPKMVIPIYIEYIPETLNNFVIEVPAYTNTNEIVESSIPLQSFLLWIYFVGLAIFSVKLLFEIGSLTHLLNTSEITKEGRYKFTKVKDKIAPFSFFNWIVLNPKQFLPQELNLIVKHEKVHVNQLHSLDLLCAQILCTILWFNPFVWLYKKALNQNLEFIADSSTQQSTPCEKSYQELLLKTSVRGYRAPFVNNFYNSLIKKRIVMLQKNKSNHYNKLKLAIVFPLLALFLMSFNTKTIYVEKEVVPTTDSYTISDELMEPDYVFNSNVKVKAINNNNSSKLATSATISKGIKTPKLNKTEVVIISKDASDNDLENIKSQLKKEGITIKFKGVKRNSKGEITSIRISAKSENSEVKYSSNDDDAIDPITIKFSDSNIYIGNGKTSKDKKEYVYITTGAKVKGHNTFTIDSDDMNIKKYTDYIFIKDGETITADELEKVYPKLVKSNRIATFNIVKGEKAVKLYAKDAKEGAVIITTGEPNETKYYIDSDNEGDANIWISKDGKKRKVKTASGKSRIVIGSDNNNHEDVNIYITKDGKKRKVKTSKKSKIYFNNGDDSDDEEIIIIEGEPKEEIIVIGEPNEEEEEIIIDEEGANVWTTEDNVTIKKIGKNKKSFFFINSDNEDGENPLFIIDGKEISRKEMNKINPDNIESIEVIKGKKATEKYGEKGKNGVVVIKTK